MSKKPSYKELEKRIKKLEKENLSLKEARKNIRKKIGLNKNRANLRSCLLSLH